MKGNLVINWGAFKDVVTESMLKDGVVKDRLGKYLPSRSRAYAAWSAVGVFFYTGSRFYRCFRTCLPQIFSFELSQKHSIKLYYATMNRAVAKSYR